jgi:hypothetical protein
MMIVVQLTDPESLYPLAQHLEDAEMGERTGSIPFPPI